MIEGQPYMDEVITREGGEIFHKGHDLWTLCTLHGERTPSFKISANRVHGHCFGCGWHGDSIDYVRALHGLTFKDALTYLGIEKRQTSTEAKAAQRERERKQELLRAFREWEQTTVNEIAEVLRSYRHMRATRTMFTEAELMELARVQSEIDILEHHYEILCSKDDEAKFGLYREMVGHGEL